MNGTQAGGRLALGDTGGGPAGCLPDGRGIGPGGRKRAAQVTGAQRGSGVASGRVASSPCVLSCGRTVSSANSVPAWTRSDRLPAPSYSTS
jgi:hypothetical protein